MPRTLLLVIPFTLVAAFSPALAGAQVIDPLAPQQARVRISAPELGDGKHVARVLSASSDQIVVQLTGRADSVTLRRRDLTSLERSEGTRSRGRRGMAIGFLVGAALGASAGSSDNACNPAYPESRCFKESNASRAAAFAIGGGIWGVIIGGPIGLLARTERWVPVDRANWASRVSLTKPSNGNAGVKIAF